MTATAATTTKFEAFIASLRSKATRTTYESGIKEIPGSDPDALLSMDPARAKNLPIDFVIDNRETLTGATIASRPANVKAFCDEHGFNLDWKIISRKVPAGEVRGRGQGPHRGGDQEGPRGPGQQAHLRHPGHGIRRRQGRGLALAEGGSPLDKGVGGRGPHNLRGRT